MYDLHDWKERCSEKVGAGKSPSPALLGQAAVRAENLTGDPNWDTFLSYLSYALEQARAEEQSMLALWRDPSLVDYPRLMAAKIATLRLQERITVLEAVLALPGDIIKSGKGADDRLHAALPPNVDPKIVTNPYM